MLRLGVLEFALAFAKLELAIVRLNELGLELSHLSEAVLELDAQGLCRLLFGLAKSSTRWAASSLSTCS